MIKRLINNLIIFGCILALWWLITYLGLVSKIIIPKPQDTFLALLDLIFSGEILDDLLDTVYRVIFGLGLGIILGIPMGLILGIYRRIYSLLEFWIDLLRSIPPPTLIPLFLLFFGFGNASKIAIAAYVSTLIIAINTMYGVHNMNYTRLIFSKTIKLDRFSLFYKVILPDSLPYVSSGVRIAISLSLVVVIVGEMLMGTNLGLGKKIVDFHLIYDIPAMYAVIILTGLIGYLFNKIYLLFEKKFIHWQGK